MRVSKSIWILEDDDEAIVIYREILDLKYKLKFFRTLEEFRIALEVADMATSPLFALPDLFIADLRLPDGQFLDFVQDHQHRKMRSRPFLVISSCDDVDILRECFDEGAADYLTKPFVRNELIAKVDRFLAPPVRIENRVKSVVSLDPINLILKGVDESDVQLTATEQQIITVFFESDNETISRRELLERIWNGVSVSPKTLDVHLVNLRKKLRRVGLDIVYVPPQNYRLLWNGMNSVDGISV